MKKIFTLIATALFTMGAYAQSTDVVELSGETLDLEKSVKPNFIFTGTDITIEMDRDPKVVENHGWKKGINIKNNGVGTIKLPTGTKLYGIEIYGFSQGDNWEYLLGWGSGEQTVNGGYFEWVDPIGANVKDNDEIKTKAKYPMDPCFFKSEAETVEYTNKLVMAEKFLDEPYEGGFSFTFSGNNQCDAMFVLYLSKEATEKMGAGNGSTATPEIFKVSAEAHSITSDGTSIDAGYKWGSIEGAIDVYNPFATTHKPQDCKNNDFIKVIIDGAEIATSDGVQGQDNPKDADGGNPALTLKPAVGGAVIQIDAKKNGWVYIVAKLSTNKQYMVFEEGAPIGYKIAMEVADDRVANGVLNLEIKGEGEFNNIPEGRQIQWVIREYLNDVEAATAGNGLGVLYFPVAEGCKYLAHATGSKISWSGICFGETEAKSVTVEGDGISKTLVGNSTPTGIQDVKIQNINEGIIYNLAGQVVDENYKGIVILNGKKMIQK